MQTIESTYYLLQRVVAFSSLLVLWPVLAVIAGLILLFDGRPVLFCQRRLGRHMRPFNVLKFCTLTSEGRVRRTGTWLRKTGLDELLQIVNVVRGEMALVGPRPLTAEDVLRLGWHREGAGLRFRVRPGITGLGQIFGGQSARQSAALERIMLRQSGAEQDLRCIVLTLLALVSGKRLLRRWLARGRGWRKQPGTCWSRWQTHFEANLGRPDPHPEAGLPIFPLDTASRNALAGSLAVFQLGESGEGRIAHEIDRCRLPGINDAYRRSLKLFVGEEGRHGRLLGHVVRSLGGRLIEKNWTASLFVFFRRLLGVRLKLLVLLAAEIVSMNVYTAFARALPPGFVRGTLRAIRADEVAHLRFHAEFFRQQLKRGGPLLSLLFPLVWIATVSAALGSVLLDHGANMRRLGIPRARIVAGFASKTWLVLRLVFSHKAIKNKKRPKVERQAGPAPASLYPPAPAYGL